MIDDVASGNGWHVDYYVDWFEVFFEYPGNHKKTREGRSQLARARDVSRETREWCLHCGNDTCEHAARHNAAYGGAG